jgi:steroid delta-isomerase-like uncharacterized protein
MPAEGPAAALTDEVATPPEPLADSPEMTRAIVERYLNETDVSTFAEEATFTVPTSPQPLKGRQAIANWFRNFQIGFPDAALEATLMTCTDKLAAVELQFTGVNTTPYLGMEPNYNHVSVPMAGFFEIANGEIVRGRVYYDPGELARQIVT